MTRWKNPMFYIAILGALKIILNAFGLDIITDEQVNAIANGIAAIVTVVGIIINWPPSTKVASAKGR